MLTRPREEAPAGSERPAAPGLAELFLIKLRYKEGRLVELSGNKPLLLGDAAAVWAVYAGQVDVFAVEVRNGEPVGPRTHIFRATTGQALFGISFLVRGDRSFGLLATGAPGTQLLRLRASRLRELSRESNYAHDVLNLVEGWVVNLTGGLARGVPPTDYVPLVAGQCVALSAGNLTRPKDGVLWARTREGASHYDGRGGLRVTPEHGYFPVTKPGWLQAAGPVDIDSVLDSEQYLAQPAAGFGLDPFHQVVLEGIVLQIAETEERERGRLKAKIAADRLSMGNAVARLASAWGADTSAVRLSDEDSGGDVLLAACKLVGQVLKVQVKPYPLAERGRVSRDPLGDIVRASRLRARRVVLRDRWWVLDTGPLLAFRRSDRRPVALLPVTAGGTGFVVEDPVDLTRTRVDATVAATLDSAAYTFYRPFPDRALSAWDLVRFGFEGSRGDLLTVLLMGVVGGLLGLLTPLATGAIFDTLIPSASRDGLIQLGMALVVSALGAAIFQATRSIALLRIEGRMDATIQAAVWDRLLSLPVPFFQQYSAGDLAARAMGINVIRQTLSGLVVASVLSLLFSTFNLVLLFIYDVRLALVATVLVIIAAATAAWAGVAQMRYGRELTDLQGSIAGTVLQFITGISKLRVAGVEGRAFAFWAREFSRQKQLAYQTQELANRLSVFNSAYPLITFIAIFATYSTLSAGSMTTGTFLAFNAAFSQFLAATLTVSQVALAIVGIVPVYERAKPILQTLPEVDEAKTDAGDLAGEIEVSHVSFRYGEKGPLVLDDVSLHIKPGQFVALVGASGSGKSTMLRLLLGFETPLSGAIYFDGKDLARLDVRSVRRQIGVVLQNGRLMPGDIYTNITGSSGLGLEEAWTAARMAGFDEDIKNLPMGIHTVIGEGGGGLSGGQRQRLLIARAIVNRPRILFFDEATSALDNRSQQVVSESLEHLESTRVVIAHRLSTIMNADCIFVLENHKLVQQGTYHDLINERGPFANLAKRQLA
jgi:NHLM bacteriocin system ABC transporter ATP-binding protein